MSSKSLILYILIAALGIALGVFVTNAFKSPPEPVVHSADDGHNHGAAEGEDWCAEHRVPESQCTLCHGELIAKFKETGDWCAEHGVPESHCRLCNPEIHFPQEIAGAVAGQDWCAEHRVPESQCTLCHSELIAKFKETGDWCAGHGLPESHCRLCNPDIHFAQEPQELELPPVEIAVKPDVYYPVNSQKCETDRALIQFASAETVRRSGLSLEPVIASSNQGRTIEAPAEIIFDETKVQVLTVSLPAAVVKWGVEPGTRLAVGTKICELESPEMAELQSQYLETLTEFRIDQANHARAESLGVARLISEAELQAVHGEMAMTEAHLRGLVGRLVAAGLSTSQIDQIESAGISPRWGLFASAEGALLERKAVLGELNDAGKALVLMGDPNALWIEGKIRERDAGDIRVGEMIEYSSDGSGLDRFHGKIFWVSQFIDPQSRTITIRARLHEPNQVARANRFGRVLIRPEVHESAILVPKDAVQWEGCCNVVFVNEAAGKFRPRKVNVERGDRTHYRVSSGLSGGETIVVKGSYLLKTELMRSSMGSGCCGIEPES